MVFQFCYTLCKMHTLPDNDMNTIIPGVVDAYAKLRSKEGRGLYTSRGRFFNHTIFGRDSSMSAKFVTDFDHEAAVEVITVAAASFVAQATTSGWMVVAFVVVVGAVCFLKRDRVLDLVHGPLL